MEMSANDMDDSVSDFSLAFVVFLAGSVGLVRHAQVGAQAVAVDTDEDGTEEPGDGDGGLDDVERVDECDPPHGPEMWCVLAPVVILSPPPRVGRHGLSLAMRGL